MKSMRVSLRLLVVMSLILVGLPASVSASGYAVSRFGGEHGTPVSTNPSVIYYNPAGLAFSAGHRLMIDANLAFRHATYQRAEDAISTQPASDLDIAANTGTGTVDNFLVSPFIGFATDFGTDIPLSIGVGFFAPFGGQSDWELTDEVEGAPGAVDGPQRWYVTEGTIRSLAASLGVAYKIESIRLSFGLSGTLYLSSIDTIRARNSDGTDRLVTESGRLQEGRSWLEASSTDIGLGAGVMWEPVEDTLWVGASYQSQPGFGEMKMEGTLLNLLGSGAPDEGDIVVTQGLPDIFRLGVRYRPMDDLELRLFGDFTRWSKLEGNCIVDASVTDVDTVCEVDANGAQVNDTDETDRIVQNILRRWDDTFGARLGASYWLLERDLELIAGAGYDGNAVPDQVLEPALQDYTKVTFSLGAKYQFTDWFAFSLTGIEVLYFERDTRGVTTAEGFASPSNQPSSAGVYNQNIFLINTGLEFTF